ncbi:MAG: 4-aminobutyrate--2-oxoglutarate transaminase [Desulfobacterales bacterium]|nr:4-aminobutyrate--2-oxoglutarate transaminase [Desulfobacterales bacterium]
MSKNSNKQLGQTKEQFVSKSVSTVSAKFIESGSGAVLKDVEGNEYIDFAGGIGVMNIGHGHPKVIEAIKTQAEKLIHTCFMVNPYEPAVKLAEKLCSITPGKFEKKAFFANSGAEAVENAIKIARYYTKRPAIVVFDNAYHGRTQLTMTMTAKVKPYKFGFGPFAPEVYRMPLGIGPDEIRDFFVTSINPEAVAAIICEPVQGEGGFIVPPKEFFKNLVEICHEHGILFIADEIQSGMGRTGKMFAIEHFGVEPDLMTVAKSLAAGMPLSAVVGKAEIMDSVHPGGIGGTYGGNPVACAAALAVLDVFENENLLEKSVALGEKLETRFKKWQEKYEIVGELRGIGAMRGFLIGPNLDKATAAGKARELAGYCHENGLIALSCGIFGNIIRTLIPFVITDDQLEKGLSIMEEGLNKISK